MPDLPVAVHVDDVLGALRGLGIPTDNLASVTFSPRRITTVHYRTNAEGRKFAAGGQAATVTTDIKVEGVSSSRTYLADTSPEGERPEVDVIRAAG